ncbi:MAG TPA: YjjG family noncanonical pyrimidine nucleotidase [Spirochaetia bacterium]|jgi:YjjG family noncanonical pyrimidine nucleotidase|nr:YjjG family noncanonical pyrimidine nucleotidase [Spirochaetia bacterium]
MYELILFDADDTLFDFVRAEAWAFDKTLEALGRKDPDGAVGVVYRRINRGLWADLEAGRISKDALRVERFRRTFTELGWDAPATEASETFVARLAEAAFLLPGAGEICQALAGNHRLVIVTNGITEVQKGRLARSGLAPWIDHLVISDEVGVAKPDPAIFAHALVRAGHPEKATVLMVGDSLSSDIRGGQNFGIDTCWFNPGGLPCTLDVPPTHEIRSLGDLRNLC